MPVLTPFSLAALPIWFTALLLYPLLEEVVFRYGLLDALDKRVLPSMRGWKNNLVTSTLFACAHLWAWSLSHAALVLLPSLCLGWLWQKQQSLRLCIAVHAAMNGFYWLYTSGFNQ